MHDRGVLAGVDGGVKSRAVARVRVCLERHRLERVVGRDVLEHLGVQARGMRGAGSRALEHLTRGSVALT